MQATTKFVIYTLVGSLLMLAAAVATGILATPDGGQTTFVLSELARSAAVGRARRTGSSCFFAAAFLVKMPAFPLHGWMPDAYRAAPDAGGRGALGRALEGRRLRLPADLLPLFPDAAVQFQELLLVIAVASILYGSVMAFTQTSATLVVGYSSIAQLGFITLGIFSLRPTRAPRERCSRWSTTGSSSRRCSSSSRCSPRAPAAPTTCGGWAGSRSARRCWRRCS